MTSGRPILLFMDCFKAIESCMPAATARKQVTDAATPVPYTVLQPQNQQGQAVPANKGVKRGLFLDEPQRFGSMASIKHYDEIWVFDCGWYGRCKWRGWVVGEGVTLGILGLER
ncbi:hypothetical protein D8674_041778 [Pyrus ussuriensis x Pyrus communis]|uniref:Uncharacterized protein n=1 Tax=Pyrus ussuriensis x Pyrus communis TaxID=2448454 RepID=A0A5N5GCA2_9ROSA|nr:hypothetical protein D8674_019182 [Pyrus ussuriensis x Pyrus communis]KAB2623696.1 hypothetical protein D8674_041778 [Pyrus ussuriensis x Pyrus communis]